MFEIIDIIEKIVIIVIKSRTGFVNVWNGIELINPSKNVIICIGDLSWTAAK